MKARLLLSALVMTAAACDRIGRENGRIDAVPEVRPPLLSPVEIKPPTLDRSDTSRVKVVDPPNVDATQVDLLKQSDGVVDILWVIDDSGSMANERKRLVSNFDRFLAELSSMQVDYQMGVTTVSMQDKGELRGTTKIISNKTANQKAVFEANTTFPASRNRWEMGLRMAQLGLSSPAIGPTGANAGLVRPKAALGIIVVTNEDDSSFGTTDYYARAFRGLKGKGNENLVSFSVIGGTMPNGCTPPGEAALYGSLADPAFRYAEVAARTGGVIGSICDTSFESTLVRIAQALNTLRRVFPLTLKPLLQTLRVSVVVGGVSTPIVQDPVAGWQYRADSNSVVFLGTYVPPPGALVRIDYAFSKS